MLKLQRITCWLLGDWSSSKKPKTILIGLYPRKTVYGDNSATTTTLQEDDKKCLDETEDWRILIVPVNLDSLVEAFLRRSCSETRVSVSETQEKKYAKSSPSYTT